MLWVIKSICMYIHYPFIYKTCKLEYRIVSRAAEKHSLSNHSLTAFVITAIYFHHEI